MGYGRETRNETTKKRRRADHLSRLLPSHPSHVLLLSSSPCSSPAHPSPTPQPLTSLTSQLALTYSSCNPAFRYEVAHNPRRVLTKPSKGVLNDGHDNEENDYILYVNDWLGTEEGHK